MSHSASSASVRPGVSRRRFFVNLLLLIGLIVAAYIWLQRHLKHHLESGLMIGGTLGVWACFEMVHGLLDWAAEDEMKAIPQRILGSRHSTWYLVFGYIVVAGLNLCTSSVWIEYDARAPGAKVVNVTVMDVGRGVPLAPELSVSPLQPEDGRTFFFRFRSTPLEIRMTEPLGFAPQRATLRAGGRVHLTTEFTPKEFHVVRLLLSPGLLSKLSEPGATVGSAYAVEIEAGGKKMRVADVRKQAIYIGADEGEAKLLIERETGAKRRERWNALLAALSVEASDREPIVTCWERPARVRDHEPFAPGAPITCRLLREKDDHVVAEKTFQLDSDHELTDVFLH